MEFTADSAAGLEDLRSRRIRQGVRRIRLAGPLADERAERAFNRAYFACGCELGSIAVMAALVGSLIAGLLLGFDGAFAWWRILIHLAAAAVVGKITGLAIARLRLRRLYRRLQARVDQVRPDRIPPTQPAPPR